MRCARASHCANVWMNTKCVVSFSSKLKVAADKHKYDSYAWIPVQFSEYDQWCCGQCYSRIACLKFIQETNWEHSISVQRLFLWSVDSKYLSMTTRQLGISLPFESDQCRLLEDLFELSHRFAYNRYCVFVEGSIWNLTWQYGRRTQWTFPYFSADPSNRSWNSQQLWVALVVSK